MMAEQARAKNANPALAGPAGAPGGRGRIRSMGRSGGQ